MAKKESAKNSKNIKNIVSIVLGSISIVASFLFPFLVIVTGIIGLILAYNQKGKGFEKSNLWAFILNVISVFLALIVLSFIVVGMVYYLSSNSGLLAGN